ncbi:MAG: hypothetical protein H6704_20425 [Myxococcales bacterium]|nr:hypothetical protein [Myxococcales bacterium]
MRAAFTVTMVVFLGGCIPGGGGGGGGACVPGQVGVCGCPDGSQGTAICQENGRASACMCGASPGGGDDAGVGATDDAGRGGWRPPTRRGDGGVIDPPPPEDCEDGASEQGTCEAGGERERRCVGGVWAAWSACIDPDAPCADGDTEQLACGLNGRGLQERACADGRWAAPGACVDEDACVDGARDPLDCPDGSVVARTCVDGQWGQAPACPEGPDPDCEAGSFETRGCGAGGQQRRSCDDGGAWSPWGDCEGEAVCAGGDEETRACEGGTQRRICADGQWGAWGACERVVRGCGEATPLNLAGDTPFDTRNRVDALPDGCGADSAEQIFSFDLDRTTHLVIEVTQADFDTILGVREDCEADLLCDDDGGRDTLSKLDVELQPGRYHVVVEGYGAARGRGTLTTTVFAPDDEPDPPPPGELASWAGVRNDVPEAEVLAGGFQRCWSDTYDDVVSPEAVRFQCDADVLLLGCRPVGRGALTVAAMGTRAEVLRPVADTADATHAHNGVAWYFTEGRAWGFAPAGAEVNRNHCDTTAGDQRVCWHLDAGGFRCGDTQWLNDDGTWERVIYQRAGAL